MKKLLGYVTIAVICMAVSSVQAEEPWLLHDDFGGRFMDINAISLPPGPPWAPGQLFCFAQFYFPNAYTQFLPIVT